MIRAPLPWLDLWRAPLNALSFGLRQTLRHARGSLPEPRQESKAGLYDYLDGEARSAAQAREAQLCERYDLGLLRQRSTCLDYRDNVYLLDVLERLWTDEGVRLDAYARLRVVDVGSQTFAYATALERFFARTGRPPSAGREVDLTGVELDGHVPYRDGFARCDWARAHAALTGNPRVRYQVADFGTLPTTPAEVVTMLYPFVTRLALLRWGLPLTAFAPERLIARAASRLDAAGGGWLVVLSQTAEEREVLTDLLGTNDTSGPWKLLRTEPIPAALVDYGERVDDRQASLFRRERAQGASSSSTA